MFPQFGFSQRSKISPILLSCLFYLLMTCFLTPTYLQQNMMISLVFFRSRKIVNMLSSQLPATFNYYPLSLTSGVLQLILLKRSLLCSVILSRKPWANSKLNLTTPNRLGLQAVNICDLNILDQKLTLKQHIHTTRNQIRVAKNKLQHPLGRNSGLSIKHKLFLCSSYHCPILRYVSDI